MLRSARALVVLAAGAALVAGGCSKPPAPKVDAAKEQADATARAKERTYGGEAVKALETARAFEAEVSKKAEEATSKAEK